MSDTRFSFLRRRWAVSLGLSALAGCSAPHAGSPAGRHAYELALAWAAGASTDGFHFPVSCPGPQKLVLFRGSKFELSCDAKEKVASTPIDVSPDESAGDAAPASPANRPLDCYLVVVPGINDVAGVLADMRRGIAARRSGPVDCALIRYR
jgi:hypothetical protein